MTTIDTTKAQRRPLRFSAIEDALAEMDRIIASEKAGKLRRTGNWTAGQVFGHLSTWIEYGYSGYPMKVPFFIRWMIRRKKDHYLRDGMPAGVRIPRTPDGTFGTEVLSTDEGAKRLRASLARLQRAEPPTFHSPAFGPMSQDERVALNLRHCELHMGFLWPE